MDRRTFLFATAAGATAAALSTWFTAHADEKAKDDPLDGKPGSKHLKAAYRAARDTGRPLLVLVEHHEPAKVYGRRILSVAINNASEALLADLALCEVVYTTTADLALLVPAAAKLGSPMMFLVEPSRDAAVQAIDVKLDDLPAPDRGFGRGKGKSYEETKADAEKAVRARIARVSKTIHTALAADTKMLERRATTNLTAIGNAAWAKTAAALRKGQAVPEREVLAAAPVIRLEAERNAKNRKAFLGALVAARTKTIQKDPPPGAKWATTHGCGMSVEGVHPEGPGVACGMGYIAPLSSRFLIHYTQE